MVICRKTISELNKGGPEDDKYNYYLVETGLQCNFRQKSHTFLFASAEFSYKSKNMYAESRAQVKEKIHIKKEEKNMGNEEYINLVNI